jgi:hypothetical protein
MTEEDEAFEQLSLKQGQWHHISGNRKRQIMEREMNLPPKVPKAFPNAFWREDDGMDLRDWFAGLAMQGLIASPRGTPDGSNATTEYYAKCAYLMADAMLKAREA